MRETVNGERLTVNEQIFTVNRSPLTAFMNENGKESLNFQISIAIYIFGILIIGVLFLMSTIGTVVLQDGEPTDEVIFGFIVFFLIIFIPMIIISLLSFILVPEALAIVAAVKANKGEHYRYPLSIRLIR